MAFRISDLTLALQYGVQKAHNYMVQIFTPIPDSFMRYLRVLCHTAVLPGRDFETRPFTTYGVPRKMPSHINYGDTFDVEFYCTGWMRERIFFDRWQSYIANPTNFYFNYFDNYKANILVGTYTEDGRNNYLMQIEECYPVSLAAQQLGYGKHDVLNLSVKFAFRRWRNMIDVANESGAIDAVDISRGNDSGRNQDDWSGNIAPKNPIDITEQDQVVTAARNNISTSEIDRALEIFGRESSNDTPPNVTAPERLQQPEPANPPPTKPSVPSLPAQKPNSTPPPAQQVAPRAMPQAKPNTTPPPPVSTTSPIMSPRYSGDTRIIQK